MPDRLIKKGNASFRLFEAFAWFLFDIEDFKKIKKACISELKAQHLRESELFQFYWYAGRYLLGGVSPRTVENIFSGTPIPKKQINFFCKKFSTIFESLSPENKVENKVINDAFIVWKKEVFEAEELPLSKVQLQDSSEEKNTLHPESVKLVEKLKNIFKNDSFNIWEKVIIEAKEVSRLKAQSQESNGDNNTQNPEFEQWAKKSMIEEKLFLQAIDAIKNYYSIESFPFEETIFKVLTKIIERRSEFFKGFGHSQLQDFTDPKESTLMRVQLARFRILSHVNLIALHLKHYCYEMYELEGAKIVKRICEIKMPEKFEAKKFSFTGDLYFPTKDKIKRISCLVDRSQNLIVFTDVHYDMNVFMKEGIVIRNVNRIAESYTYHQGTKILTNKYTGTTVVKPIIIKLNNRRSINLDADPRYFEYDKNDQTIPEYVRSFLLNPAPYLEGSELDGNFFDQGLMFFHSIIKGDRLFPRIIE